MIRSATLRHSAPTLRASSTRSLKFSGGSAPSKVEIRRYLEDNWHEEPLWSGMKNGVRITVCRNGIAHPNPTCLQAIKHWRGGFEAFLDGAGVRYELLSTGTSPRPRYWYKAPLLEDMITARGGDAAWEALRTRYYLSHGDNWMDLPLRHPESFPQYFYEHFLDLLKSPRGRAVLEGNFHMIDTSRERKSIGPSYAAFLNRVARAANEGRGCDFRSIQWLPGLHIVEWIGIGPGGHVWFMERANGSVLNRWWGIIPIAEENRQRTDVDYDTDFAEAFTLMGIPTFQMPHEINMIVNKPGFAEVLRQIITEPYDRQKTHFIPARDLMHPDVKRKVHFFLSEEAARLLC